MSASFDIDLAGLNLEDDNELAEFGNENPEDYQGAAAVAPPREGNYVARITDIRPATEFQSEKPLLDDGKWPVLEIRAIEILEPQEVAGRTVRMNQKIRTKPFERDGAKGKTRASGLLDLLRSFDATRPSKGVFGDGDGTYPTQLQLLKEFVESGATFRGRGQWRAYDKDYADKLIDAGGGRDALSNQELGKINNKVSTRGMKKFPKTSNGNYVPEIVGEGGNILTAKFVIAEFYSSDKKVSIKLS